MDRPFRFFIVDDDEGDIRSMLETLKMSGRSVEHATVEPADEAGSVLMSGNWDIVSSMHRTPHYKAAEAMRLAQESNIDVPIVIMSKAKSKVRTSI